MADDRHAIGRNAVAALAVSAAQAATDFPPGPYHPAVGTASPAALTVIDTPPGPGHPAIGR